MASMDDRNFLVYHHRKSKDPLHTRGVIEEKNLSIECKKSLRDLNDKNDPLRQIVVVHYKDYQ